MIRKIIFNKKLTSVLIFICIFTFFSFVLPNQNVSRAAISLSDYKSAIDLVAGSATMTFTSGSVQTGDVVIVYGGHGYVAGGSVGPYASYGYTLIASYHGASRNPTFGVWYKVMGATPDTEVCVYGSSNSNYESAYALYVLRGTDTSSILDTAAVGTGPNNGNPNGPPITTTRPGVWVIPTAGNMTSDTNRGTLAGYSYPNGTNANGSIDISVDAATRYIASPTTVDPPAWTSWNATSYYAITLAIEPEFAPTVSASSPPDSEVVSSLTPDFIFLGVDSNSDDITYNIQIDKVNTFNSADLIDRVSSSHTGFVNTINRLDSDPFTSGQAVKYTVQAADTLDAGVTYYWRVRGIDRQGGAVYSDWTATRSFSTPLSVSGIIYQTNESSPYQCNTSGNLTVYLRVDNGSPYSATCSEDTGAWNFPSISASSGQTLTIYTYGGSVRGSTVLIFNGSSTSSVPIYQNRVIVRDDLDGSVTNSEISAGDTSDGDDLLTFSGSNLTVNSSYEIHIYTGDTYAPGADVSTGKLHVVGNYSGDTETLTLTASGETTSRPLYIKGGKFTAPATTTFSGTTDVDIEATNFNALNLTPTIPTVVISPPTYTFLGASSVNGDFVIRPISGGATRLTVLMGGAIVVQPTSTTYVSATTSALSTLDTVLGSNYSLTTGYINIEAAGTLEGRDAEITLTGISDIIFTKSGGGTFNYGTSNVTFSQTSGNTTLTSMELDFYDLTINMSGRTGTLGADTNIFGNLAVSAGTLSNDVYVVTTSGDFSGSGNFLQGNATFTVGGDWTNTGTFTASSGATSGVILSGTSKQITGPSGGISFYNLSVTGTYTNNNSGTITINSAFTGAGTWTQGTDSTLRINSTSAITGLDASSNTNTVIYGGGGNQTVKGVNYSTLNLSSSGVKTMTGVTSASGSFNILDTATMTDNDSITVGRKFTYNSSGSTTLTSSRDIKVGSFELVQGTLVDNGNTIQVTGSGTTVWTLTGGTFTPTGTAYFTGETPGIGSSNFNNLTIATSGTASLDGSITTEGNVEVSSGTLFADTYGIYVKGDWIMRGTFLPGTGKVAFNGIYNQLIKGDTNFYDLAITRSTPSGVITFYGGGTTGVTGSLVLQGAPGALLTLKSHNTSDWNLDVDGATVEVTYVAVSHSNASGGDTIDATDKSNVDQYNNTNWLFYPTTSTDLFIFNFDGQLDMEGLNIE